jgi:cytochrome c556
MLEERRKEFFMNRRLMYIGALIVAGWLYTTASDAHESHPKKLPDVKDTIAFRTYLMENIGENAKEMNDKIKAGKIKQAKINAQAIALHSTRIIDLFPKDSMSETSRAKDEIWQKWDEFVKSSETFRTEVDQFALVAAVGKENEAKEQLKKVFGGCKSCHDSFRKPDKDEQQ